ncbi:DUF6965 family protein [Niabella aurantiaca]|uniref:DUF6965 family protein n=1 Tax=Niabella aurantiaca TaxID=379900 RepID=UPI00059253E3|nr:hypothetical protein [Niabella aurantiaca]
MRPPLSRIEALEAFFAGRKLPEMLHLDAASTQYNPQEFVSETLRMLKDGSFVEIIAWCRVEHLEKIRDAMEKSI